MWRALLDIVYPPACAACATRLSEHARAPWCAACEPSVSAITAPLCTGCGEPFGGEGPPHPCRRCLERPPAFELARATLAYGGAVSQAIGRYKFGGAEFLSRELGALIACDVEGLDPGAYDAVIPVPLHPRRLAERGFDHTVPLARAVAARHRRPVWLDVLARVRHTPPQSTLTGTARAENLRGAFVVRRPSKLAGRRVVLVDDVLTTGATARAAASALREGGAASVVVLTLARAL